MGAYITFHLLRLGTSSDLECRRGGVASCFGLGEWLESLDNHPRNSIFDHASFTLLSQPEMRYEVGVKELESNDRCRWPGYCVVPFVQESRALSAQSRLIAAEDRLLMLDHRCISTCSSSRLRCAAWMLPIGSHSFEECSHTPRIIQIVHSINNVQIAMYD